MDRPTWIDPAVKYPPYDVEKFEIMRKFFYGELISQKLKTNAMYGVLGVASALALKSFL